ncbi:MAG: DMT family transporter [Salinivirgaceae bacterium]|jgi:drug/metabolite transporter (DMT)-like permease|nr:DMT family transporter [Salinivirgaceae bacterium]
MIVLGIILLCGAVLSALGYAAIIIRLTNKYNSFTIISIQNSISFLLFLSLFLIFDIENFKQADLNYRIIINLLYIAILGSSLAYVFFTFAIKKLGITVASLFTNTIPVFIAIFAYFLIGEHLSFFKIFGIIIVIIGLFLGQKKSKYKKLFSPHS